MAISIVGTPTHNSQTAQASVTVAPDASTASGDMMLALFLSNNQAHSVTGGGWTALWSQVDNTNLYRATLFYRVLTAAPAANYTFTVPLNQSPLNVSITTVRGMDKSLPFGMSANNFASSLAGAVSEPSNTPSVTGNDQPDGRVFYFRAVRFGVSPVPVINPTAGAITTLVQDGISSGGSVSYAQGVWCANADSSTLGATVSGWGSTCTQSENTNVMATVVVSLPIRKPLPGVAAATATVGAETTSIAPKPAQAPATASAKAPSVLTGRIALPGVAAAIAAVPDVGRRAYAGSAAVSAVANGSGIYYGAPASRTYVFDPESRTLRVLSESRTYQVLPDAGNRVIAIGE